MGSTLPPSPSALPHPEPPRENLEATEVQVEELLAKLHEDVRERVRTQLNPVIEYCQKNKFNFSDWKNYDADKHLGQVTRIYELLGLNTSRNFDDLKNPSSPFREELNTLIVLMETRNEILQEGRTEQEDLSADVASGGVKKVAEHVKGLFREHPLATIFASGMALWAGAALWNSTVKIGDKERPIFKYAMLGTAGAFSLNHLLGPIFGGRDALDAIMDMPDSKFEELLAGAEDKMDREVDKRAFRAMIHMGQVPFSVFLNAYQRSLQGGKLEIDMRHLARAARRNRFGRQVPRHYFDQKNGKGMFAEMERLVGGKTEEGKLGRIAFMQQKYIDNGLNMSLYKVMFAEYVTTPEDAEVTGTAVAAGTVAATVSGGLPGTTVAPPAAPELKIDQPLTDELSGVHADLAALHPEVLEGGTKVRIMGFTVDVVRTKDDAKGDFFYEFDADPGQTPPIGSISLDLSSKATPADKTNAISQIKTALQARADRLAKAIEPSLAPQWNPVAGKWELLPLAMPWHASHFTQLGLTPPSSLPLRMNINENNAVELFYGGQQILSLDDLRETIKEDGVETALRSQPDTANLFRGLDVEVTEASVWSRILINVEGATFMAMRINHPAPGKFFIYDYNSSPRFIAEKSRAIQERPDFKKIFGDLALSGQKLSDFTRTALDYMRFRFSAADSKNHYWLQLVELKKFELVYEYEQALRGVQDGGGADIIGRLNVAEEEFARSLRSFNNYPNDLTNARDDANRYEALEKDFWMLGYGSEAYRSRTEAFYTTVDALNFEGWTEKSNPVHQAMVFNIMRLWYERTRELKDIQSFSSNQTEYLDQLQQSFTGILGRGILQDTGFLQRVNEGISYDEFKRMRPEFDVLPTYMGWQIDTGKTEALIASLPLLGQVGGTFNVIPGPAPAHGSTIQSATIDFGGGITWEIAFDSSKPAGEQIDLTKINMTPDMVSAHVRSVENSPNFNKPFERLQNLWTNMEDQHWSELAKGNWRTFLTGTVEQGRWKSLVEHKRGEALRDYEADLSAALSITNPTKRRIAWFDVQQNFGTLYLGGIDLIGTTVAQGIDQKLQKVPPEKLDQFDFLNAITDLQGAGYRSNGYILQMQSLRRDIGTFDYGVGWERLDSTRANDIMNKIIALQHKYMRGMVQKPGIEAGTTFSLSQHFRSLDNTEWTPDHGAYFHYVKLEIMHYLRGAYNNNADATGTWLDHAIGADEIPRELNLKTFEEFLADPNGAMLGLQNFEAAPGSGRAPAETPEQAAVRITRFRGRLDQILKEKFLDKVEANNTAQKEGWEVGNVDEDDAKSAEGELRIMLDKAVEYVKNHPGSEDQKADAFEDQVKAQYRALQGSRLWPWNWGQ